MSVDLFLGLSGRRCRVPGCMEDAGMYGCCSKHQERSIDAVFAECVENGWASMEAPPCFRSHGEWREYVVAWRLSVRQLNGASRLQVEFCRDCTPKYKAHMQEQGRCTHPETVFIRPHQKHGDEMVGVPIFNYARTGKWQSAVMGMGCDVVALPSETVVGECLERIAIESAPKKRGRKPKVIDD